MIQDEGKFDPKSIPLKSWSEYVCFPSYHLNLGLTPLRKMNCGIRNLTTV